MKKSSSSKTKATASNGLPLAVFADQAALTELHHQTGLLSRAWDWLQSRKATGADSRRLRVADTVSLGEKRFVAVVQVAGRDFLIAGGPTNIALLAQLNPKEPFEDVLRSTLTIPGQQPAKRKRTVKRKPAKAKPAPPPPAIDLEAAIMSEPQTAQFQAPGNFGHVLQKSIKPARRPPPKRKQAATPDSHESDEHTEPENSPLAAAYNMPDAFRYVLQNTIATDGKATNGKLANPPNGRSETEHTGHWA